MIIKDRDGLILDLIDNPVVFVRNKLARTADRATSSQKLKTLEMRDGVHEKLVHGDRCRWIMGFDMVEDLRPILLRRRRPADFHGS
jgi:hypothetical protein